MDPLPPRPQPTPTSEPEPEPERDGTAGRGPTPPPGSTAHSAHTERSAPRDAVEARRRTIRETLTSLVRDLSGDDPADGPTRGR